MRGKWETERNKFRRAISTSTIAFLHILQHYISPAKPSQRELTYGIEITFVQGKGAGAQLAVNTAG